MPDSRRAILIALKTQGPSTIAQLAELLALTGEAVRQQLLQLQREGWVESRIARSEERGRTGRPATRYSLTEAGIRTLPILYALGNWGLDWCPGAEKLQIRQRIMRDAGFANVFNLEGGIAKWSDEIDADVPQY